MITVYSYRGTTRAYAAYNPGGEPLAVTFTDGHRMTVPARKLHHEKKTR